MGVNDQVFASKSERENFYKLSRQWGQDYRIYHNLPFLNVFNPKDLFDLHSSIPERIKLTSVEYNRLKKTSIDYTLCDKFDKPVVCLEFDGMQQGYNIGMKYHSDIPSNPWRQEITDLKLRVAHGSHFPFFVFNSKEFEDIASTTKVTIVDGIVGVVLASKQVHQRIKAGFKPETVGMTREEFDALNPEAQDWAVQDWVIGVEVEAEVENNPITKKVAELKQQVASPIMYSLKYLATPEVEAATTLDERVRRLSKSTHEGVKLVVEKPERMEVEVWLPRHEGPYYSGLGLLEEIAMLLVLVRLTRSMDRGSA